MQEEKDFEFYKKFYDDNRVRLLQYESLRKNFREMIKDVLGEGYYNTGMDVYDCDREACIHITNKANESWLTKLINKITGWD